MDRCIFTIVVFTASFCGVVLAQGEGDDGSVTFCEADNRLFGVGVEFDCGAIGKVMCQPNGFWMPACPGAGPQPAVAGVVQQVVTTNNVGGANTVVVNRQPPPPPPRQQATSNVGQSVVPVVSITNQGVPPNSPVGEVRCDASYIPQFRVGSSQFNEFRVGETLEIYCNGRPQIFTCTPSGQFNPRACGQPQQQQNSGFLFGSLFGGGGGGFLFGGNQQQAGCAVPYPNFAVRNVQHLDFIEVACGDNSFKSQQCMNGQWVDTRPCTPRPVGCDVPYDGFRIKRIQHGDNLEITCAPGLTRNEVCDNGKLVVQRRCSESPSQSGFLFGNLFGK